MGVLPPFEEKIRHKIRDEMAMTSVISVTAIKEGMEEVFGRGFDYEYIRKLVGKVRNEIVIEIDRAQIEPRLASLRENYRLMREELLKIVHWKDGDPIPKPLARDKVEAAKNVVMLDLACSTPKRPPACTRSRSSSPRKRCTTNRFRRRYGLSSSRLGRAGDCFRGRRLSRWCQSGLTLSRCCRTLECQLVRNGQITYSRARYPRIADWRSKQLQEESIRCPRTLFVQIA